MKRGIFILIICVSSHWACDPQVAPFHKDPMGLWEMADVTIHIGDQDSAYTILIQQGDWAKELGMKPSRILFKEHHHFEWESAYTNDQIAEHRRGIWQYQPDSLLIMIEPIGATKYQVQWEKADAMQLSATVDWDRDGLRDDAFTASLHRLSSTPSSVKTKAVQ